MGIDRIGKKAADGLAAPTASSDRLDSSRPASAQPFEPAAAAAAPAPLAAGALERLRSGNLTLGEYLEAKVDEAVGPLALPSADLDSIRSALRQRLASDPTLVDLVRCAVGAAGPRPADE